MRGQRSGKRGHDHRRPDANGKTLASPAFTGTETGMSITSPAMSDPTISGNTNVKRIKANQGSSLVVGDVGGLGAGWGSTASVASVAGNDVIGQISITSNGTGQAVNAGLTLTFMMVRGRPRLCVLR